ncbi:hypothetical protein BDR03DRAFT_947367 [Suillus americanus]|nr:hypothetical protein BDR03DRAFT_947367 [Suillus americanus]
MNDESSRNPSQSDTAVLVHVLPPSGLLLFMRVIFTSIICPRAVVRLVAWRSAWQCTANNNSEHGYAL